MALYLRIDDRDQLDLFNKVFVNMLLAAQHAGDPNSPFIHHMDTVQKILDNLECVVDYRSPLSANNIDIIDERYETKRKLLPPKPKNKKKIVDPLLVCQIHKTYQAKRSPRTDCANCWNGYKRFHPLEYNQARENFDRRNKRRVVNTKA